MTENEWLTEKSQAKRPHLRAVASRWRRTHFAAVNNRANLVPNRVARTRYFQ
jgi:hypothetical protein